MARKHKHEEHENHERWLVSYADFITLLFAFFTSMYAISTLDLQKAGRLVTSARAAFNYNPVMTGGKGTMADKDSGASAETPTIMQPVNPDGASTANEGEAGGPSAEAGGGSESAVTTTESIGNGNGNGSASSDALQQLQHKIEEALEEEGLGGRVSFKRIGLELSITLSEALFFESGSADLREDAIPALTAIARVLRTTNRDIRIEGHTDSRPISSARYPTNWELSTSRATSILRYLVDSEGFLPERLAAAGYGPYRPVASNDTADDRARNRRVELVIVGDRTVGQHVATCEAPGSVMTAGDAQ